VHSDRVLASGADPPPAHPHHAVVVHSGEHYAGT
jgi:hypothetical protein